jgi:Ca2+-binding EF-hand superfamily protein
MIMTYLKIAAAVFLAATSVANAEMRGEHFVQNWDLDNDGKVTAEEVLERRGDIFLTFDANEDAFLDAEEYKIFDQARANDMADRPHRGKRMRAAANGMRLEVNDKDGDGRVSRGEFLAQAEPWVTAMDRNGDEVISVEDFRVN